jgi:hypothetical protein
LQQKALILFADSGTLADFWRFDTSTLQWTYLGVPLQQYGVFCDGFSEPNPKADGGCIPSK